MPSHRMPSFFSDLSLGIRYFIVWGFFEILEKIKKREGCLSGKISWTFIL